MFSCQQLFALYKQMIDKASRRDIANQLPVLRMTTLSQPTCINNTSLNIVPVQMRKVMEARCLWSYGSIRVAQGDS